MDSKLPYELDGGSRGRMNTWKWACAITPAW